MRQLLETIKIIDGIPQNIFYHNERMKESYKKIFDKKEYFDLNKIINVPSDFTRGIVKCRIVYSTKIEKIEFENYKIKKINSLKIVYSDDIEYNLKYFDRTNLTNLLKKKKNCDDIIIVKDRLITDTSFSNLIFFDGKNYYTPAKPLFYGIKRRALLEKKKIIEANITLGDLINFTAVHLINAMLDIGDTILQISAIEE